MVVPAGSLLRDDAQDTHNYFRMRYPEDYKKNIAVTKFERNAGYLRQPGVTGITILHSLSKNIVNN